MLALSLVATGCYAPSPGVGAACAGAADCPDPQRCLAGSCRAPGEVPPDDAAIPLDAAFDAALPLGPWSAAIGLDVCTGCDDPSLTADELELFVNLGDVRIGSSRRAHVDLAFPPPLEVAALNEPNTSEFTPNVSSDGLAIYFGRSVGIGSSDLFVARRPTRDEDWGEAELIGELSSTENDELDPWVGPGELVMLYDNDAGDGNDIWTAARPSVRARWGPGERLDSLGPSANDSGAVMSADLLEVYFTSNRDGTNRVYTATRPAIDAAFENVQLVESTGLHGSFDPWISVDRRRLYFASTQNGATRQLFMLTR